MEADKNARIIQKNIREAAGCKIIYSLFQSRRQYNLLVALENTDERVYVTDIARSESCARQYLSLLSRELVYPCHLPEVLDELLGEAIQL